MKSPARRFFCRHFYVLPADAAAPTGLQSFSALLLPEAAHNVGGDRAARFTVGALGRVNTRSANPSVRAMVSARGELDNVYAIEMITEADELKRRQQHPARCRAGTPQVTALRMLDLLARTRFVRVWLRRGTRRFTNAFSTRLAASVYAARRP